MAYLRLDSRAFDSLAPGPQSWILSCIGLQSEVVK